MSLITLTTDFGTRDWFVGTMKGVIASLAPELRVVDITHEVAPGDVREGAFALAAAAPYFPAGTIHVAVVDPGVGSDRRAIAVLTQRAIFIGPDNGVLSWALRDARVQSVRELSNAAWFLQPVSRTFHGRDVFAPVAGRLAAGDPFTELGDELADFVRLPWPTLTRGDRRLSGEIVYVDRFGNAITNLPATELPADAAENGRVRLRCGRATAVLHRWYAAATPGEPLAVAGSSGFVELAINGGAFARDQAVSPGTPVEATW